MDSSVFSEDILSKNQSPEGETCSPVVIDNVRLNGPAVNINATESFIHQAMDIIVEDAVKKATDVREKVTRFFHSMQMQQIRGNLTFVLEPLLLH